MHGNLSWTSALPSGIHPLSSLPHASLWEFCSSWLHRPRGKKNRRKYYMFSMQVRRTLQPYRWPCSSPLWRCPRALAGGDSLPPTALSFPWGHAYSWQRRNNMVPGKSTWNQKFKTLKQPLCGLLSFQVLTWIMEGIELTLSKSHFGC